MASEVAAIQKLTWIGTPHVLVLFAAFAIAIDNDVNIDVNVTVIAAASLFTPSSFSLALPEP